MSKASMLFANIARKDAAALHEDGHLVKMARADSRRYRHLLVEQIYQDLELPAHVVAQFDHPLWLGCTECDLGQRVLSVAQVADFADQHAHCRAWVCPVCGRHEYNFRSTCRFCRGRRYSPGSEKAIVHQQLAPYLVRLQQVVVAHVEAPSLIRARRAARGMWPTAGMELTVELVGAGHWTATFERDI